MYKWYISYLLLLVEEVRLEEERDVDDDERVVVFELDEEEELLRTEDDDTGVCAFFIVAEDERVTDEAGWREELPPVCTLGVDVRVEEEVAEVVLLTVVAPEFTPVEVFLLDDELCVDVRDGVATVRSVLLLLTETGVDVRCVVFTRFVEVVVELLLVEVDTRDGWTCEEDERVCTAFLLVFSNSKVRAFLTEVFLREKLFSG